MNVIYFLTWPVKFLVCLLAFCVDVCLDLFWALAFIIWCVFMEPFKLFPKYYIKYLNTIVDNNGILCTKQAINKFNWFVE